MAGSSDKQADLFSPSTGQVYTVSELAARVRSLLEESFALVRVIGEVSGLTLASSGHAYFSLKDEQASLNAVLFRSAAARLDEIPEEGEEVECLGRLTFYQPRGRTQLVVEWMVPRGAGALGLQFMRLKAKLAKEGLFDAERKRPLPFVPACIGVVTSPSGAAIRDILKILRQRFPSVPVLLCPTKVQGEGAAQEIAGAVERLGDGRDCDVLIVGRGGGSAEDLWAFNEEVVVRAVVGSSVPVISAVGHETDIVLCDLAADVRAPTPSAAAEMVVPDRRQVRRQFAGWVDGMNRMISLRLSDARRRIVETGRRIRDPRLVLAAHRMRLDEAGRAATAEMNRRLDAAGRIMTHLRVRLAARDPRPLVNMAAARLEAAGDRLVRSMMTSLKERRAFVEGKRSSLSKMDPHRVLARGYSVVFKTDGSVLTESTGVRRGDSIRVRLHRGSLDGTVDRIHEPPGEAKTSGCKD